MVIIVRIFLVFAIGLTVGALFAATATNGLWLGVDSTTLFLGAFLAFLCHIAFGDSFSAFVLKSTRRPPTQP